MTNAVLIAEVRRRCGKVTGNAEIEDADITTEGTYCLTEIAEFIPVKVLRSITSVANQREYAVHANTRRIQTVFPWGTIAENPDRALIDFGGGDPVTAESGRSEYYNFPSLWMIEQMRRVRNLPKIKFEFHPVTRKLQLDPYPTVAGDLYWYYSIESADWTLANVPTEFAELLVLGTSIRILDVLALRRSQLGGIQRQGGFVEFPMDRLKTFSDDWKKEYKAQLFLKAKLFSR